MDQINVIDSQDQIRQFGTRCSLILDQLSLRNYPYETASHLFCTISKTGIEYRFVVKAYKDECYKLQIDFLGDYDDEDFTNLKFCYAICDKVGKVVHRSDRTESFNVSRKYSGFLMSYENLKNWTFGYTSPLILVFYIINHEPLLEKSGVLTGVKTGLPTSHLHSSTECPLSNDLSNLYEKGDLSDFTIVAEGKTFNVHKCVLAARSIVFRKHIEENIDHESMTLNLKSDIVEEMLRFIYTNTVHKLEELVYDLYNVAKEHHLQELRSKCISYMVEAVTVDNAMKLIYFAKKHDEKILQAKITDYFMKNVDEILVSKGTDEFLKPLLQCKLSLNSFESLAKD
ncbi:TD and POZ domain-containing protein 4-like isoform X2 [Phymastichus coffea]|uniref:TD and POZ domain-containing protein 4-like isoform X2 n=1 Tax=Phymastichus coffea TaxID=108790 RepID=UPI00273C37F4|nr:TD and POZ domain-containing protein 4-like isoform X2 [Phymastichus coffea]XP_058797139.1 TD and POZ domain-containing protein 4-like isoform X2 [Phymastichus coffea]XP_058797140.1 TD and POZ domain-containing protein 4-like isoform X2 [Phymastichus coffea]